MKAFLSWYSSGGFRAGEGDEWAGGPAPPLEGSDAAAWEFYCRFATPFVQEFGLMGGLIGEEKMKKPCRDLFLTKLSMIHQAVLEVRLKRQQEIADAIIRRSDDTMVAEERT